VEQVFVQSIRRAAFRLAGLADTTIDRMLPPLPQTEMSAYSGRSVRYKGAVTGSGPTGMLAVQVFPDEAEIYLADSSYGLRAVRITGIPQGEYTVMAKMKYMATRKKKVRVWPNETANAELILKSKRYFRIRPSYSRIDPWDQRVGFDLPVNLGSITDIADPILRVPAGQEVSLALGSSGLHHYLGVRFIYVSGAQDCRVTTRISDTTYSAPYDQGGGSGVYAEYSYTFNPFRRYIAIETGLLAGFSKQTFDLIDYGTQYTTYDYFSRTLGGPRVALNLGLPRIKVGCEYTLAITYFNLQELNSLTGSLSFSSASSPDSQWQLTQRIRVSLLFDI
jgi:hypothetical protein